jgi:hypothetical protein
MRTGTWAMIVVAIVTALVLVGMIFNAIGTHSTSSIGFFCVGYVVINMISVLACLTTENIIASYKRNSIHINMGASDDRRSLVINNTGKLPVTIKLEVDPRSELFINGYITYTDNGHREYTINPKTNIFISLEYGIDCTGCVRVKYSYVSDSYYLDNNRVEVAPEIIPNTPVTPSMNGVHNYSYKPDPIFLGTGSYFGVELEYKGTLTQEMVDKLNQYDSIYLKKDSSVDIEIVSHPMSLDFHKGYCWESILEILSNAEMYVDSGCGLHIHCDPRSDIEKIKIALLVYGNQSYLETIGMRMWTSYCKSKVVDLDGNGVLDSTDRHEAVNFTCDTVEFRFFKSTLNVSQLIRCIETTNNILELTKTLSVDECSTYTLK